MSSPTLAELGIGRLFDVVPDAIVVGDVQLGRVVAWNLAATAMFGHQPADAMGMPLELLVPPELREAHLAGLARYAAGDGGHLTGSRELVELPALRADGSQLWVELRLAPLDTADTQRRYVVAVFRDATTRRQAQVDAAGALEQTRAANESLRDFVAMAAHDIRSPVAGIAVAMDMLATKWDRLSEVQRVTTLDGARRHVAFVMRLLQDLLDVSSIEAGELAATPEVCDVSAVVAEAVETAGVGCELELPAGLQVVADRAHLQRALANLIGNAAKYGRPPIVVSAERSGSFVSVRVDDHGDGVEPDLEPRMFEKFARGSGAAAKPGAGLGLAIVAGLVRGNGGDVGYERRSHGGSRFTCSWPVAEAPAPRRSAS